MNGDTGKYDVMINEFPISSKVLLDNGYQSAGFTKYVFRLYIPGQELPVVIDRRGPKGKIKIWTRYFDLDSSNFGSLTATRKGTKEEEHGRGKNSNVYASKETRLLGDNYPTYYWICDKEDPSLGINLKAMLRAYSRAFGGMLKIGGGVVEHSLQTKSPIATREGSSIATTNTEPEDTTGHESKVLVAQRLDQNKLRRQLLSRGCCQVTGIRDTALVEAAHIRPWSENSDSRLDINNGLLLSPLWHKAFDLGYISFDDEGFVKTGLLYKNLHPSDKAVLDLIRFPRLIYIVDGDKVPFIPNESMKQYLRYHREHIFDKVQS